MVIAETLQGKKYEYKFVTDGKIEYSNQELLKVIITLNDYRSSDGILVRSLMKGGPPEIPNTVGTLINEIYVKER